MAARLLDSLLNRLTGRDPPRKGQRHQEALRVALLGMSRIRNLPRLLNLLAQVIAGNFRAGHVSIFLKDAYKPEFTRVASRGRLRKPTEPLSLSETNPLIVFLSEAQEPVLLEGLKTQRRRWQKSRRPAASATQWQRLNTFPRVIEEMERLQAALCVPAFLDRKLKCFFVVGELLSGRSYRQEDLTALSTLALQAALAIENAQAYEELRNTRDQLLESDRLATIGKFAASMGHEIKNPLQSIITFFEFLPEKRNDPDFMDRFAKTAQHEAKRINELVRELVTYSHLRPPRFQPLEMDQVLDSVLDLLENDLSKHHIEVRKGYSPNPMTAQADRNQMKQVFLNLFQNAIDAMASADGKDRRLEIVAFPNAEALVVKIRDTGPGIPSHLLPRLFLQPFTTKEKGIGLGLYIVHQILQAHHATIDVKSQDGTGTTMTITMPCRQSAPAVSSLAS